MPIDPEFPKNQQVIGKHMHSDGEHFHFVWGPGRAAEAAEDENVKSAYVARGEEIVPLGVHGITTLLIHFRSKSSVNAWLTVFSCFYKPVFLRTVPLIELPTENFFVEYHCSFGFICHYFKMNNSWHNNRDLEVNYLSLMLLPGHYFNLCLFIELLTNSE
jgi:hypothetical protein